MQRRPRAAQAGYSLIEILVAMVILAFGLLGVVGLQAVSIKNSANAALRAKAGLYAHDILDRLRANPARAVAGEYNLEPGQPVNAAAAAIVQADMGQWRRLLDNELIQGDGGVAVDAAGNASIVVRWSERSAGNNNGRIVAFTFSSRL